MQPLPGALILEKGIALAVVLDVENGCVYVAVEAAETEGFKRVTGFTVGGNGTGLLRAGSRPTVSVKVGAEDSWAVESDWHTLSLGEFMGEVDVLTSGFSDGLDAASD